MDTGALIWITRAEPGAAATAARLEDLGLRPLIAPMLVVHRLEAPLDMEGVAALAFTSTNGVRAFAERSARRHLPVFAVGDVTAQAARDAGFVEVSSAEDDGAALVRLISNARPMGRVLCPGPRQRAVDVAGDLRRLGIEAEGVDLYETRAPPELPEAVRSALSTGEVSAVLIHSARAGEAIARLAAPFNYSRTAAVGLSTACLAPVASLGFASRISAKRPREDALLAALQATPSPRALHALGKPPPAR